jgi:hypothetical protein
MYNNVTFTSNGIAKQVLELFAFTALKLGIIQLTIHDST